MHEAPEDTVLHATRSKAGQSFSLDGRAANEKD
jgi:hypothetical protein